VALLFQSLSVAVWAVLGESHHLSNGPTTETLKDLDRVHKIGTFLCANNTMWLDKLKSTGALREADE
jgi:hypothetical protein